jgi:CHAT domain-containing protein/tetratricopeptide (TPR) repeat protein
MPEQDPSQYTETGRRLHYFSSVIGKDKPETVLKAARDLLRCGTYEQDLGAGSLRDSYIDALFDIAEVFRNTPHYRVVSPFGVNKPPLEDSVISSASIDAWKRAYSMDDGHVREGRGASAREVAAYRLGHIYEKAQCLHTAVLWFKRALSHARSVGLTENVLGNLRGLARNLNTLGNFDEARPCYDEMLQLLEALPPQQQVSSGLAHAAMFHLQHGDQARGEEIMGTLYKEALLPRSKYFGTARIPHWFAAALHGLGMHYIAIGRAQDANTLAAAVLAQAARFDRPDLVPAAMHGLAARAHLDRGDLDAALGELAQVHPTDRPRAVIYTAHADPTTLELWLDVARIHVARGRFELALGAYQSLAYNVGALIADRTYGNTTRLRMHWLRRMVFVVHEMASVWLNLGDQEVQQSTELNVARALLQIKINLFVAVEKSKNVKNPELTERIFIANRHYAAAAGKLTATPDDEDALLELEAALFEREQLERVDLPYVENQLLPPEGFAPHFIKGFEGLSSLGLSPRRDQFSPAAAVEATMTADIRQLVGSDRTFVDYSLIDIHPPHEGREGPLQGRRYLAIVVNERDFRVRDLGDAAEIDAKCKTLIAAYSTPGALPSPLGEKRPASRDLVSDDPHQDGRGGEIDLLSADLYDRIVAPLGPLTPSLTLSPDGLLTAVPFHALMHNDRWLVEDTHITYCHSLQLLDNLYKRQLGPLTRHLPPEERVAVLLGDPDYQGTTFQRLPGTKIEITEVERLLGAARFPGGEPRFNEVRVHTGPDATASRLLAEPIPRVLHIAAHGGIVRETFSRFTERAMRFGEYYRAWDEIGAAPMTALDDGLLRCELRLTKDESARDDLASATLTALELSSLNLLGCQALVLSACETGAGIPLHGAGALGFQYAVQSTFAMAGLVSLWKVLDAETAVFMTAFYEEFLQFKERRMAASYLSTVRRYCRRHGQRVHPYYWAAFVFIDGEYDNPVPW